MIFHVAGETYSVIKWFELMDIFVHLSNDGESTMVVEAKLMLFFITYDISVLSFCSVAKKLLFFEIIIV